MFKKLPIGVQDFSKLREDGYIYVDKTALIHQIITDGAMYFIARPRRFGKSMTLATVKEIFKGSKHLFAKRDETEQDLWIYDKWDWSKKHPVILLPFARLDYKTQGLPKVLLKLLREIGEEYDVTIESDSYIDAFNELIVKLSKKLGRVVILIDEYDKPINDFIEFGTREEAKENRRLLRDFYRCVKDNDANIEFFLITGVTRFSQTGVFSHLNHLNDITMDKKYHNVIGITPEELVTNFDAHIEATALDMEMTKEELLPEIKRWYNGYSWNVKDTVYNPFSLINFFSHQNFMDFWFKSGAPKFLLDLMREQQFFDIAQLKAPFSVLDSYEIENVELRPLLFQTGYLTIKEYDKVTQEYTLDFPNEEVFRAFTHYIIATMLNRESIDSTAPIMGIRKAFLNNDIEQVVLIIKSLLKDVPTNLLERKTEAFYHALVHLHFRYLGLMIDSEVFTSDGRMDAVVKTNTHIYIFEFKINRSADAAMKQIKAKDYALKYAADNRTVMGIGINFNTQKRTMSSWKKEVLNQK